MDKITMSDYRPILTEYLPYLHEMRIELSERSLGKRFTLRTIVAFCIESGYYRLFGRRIRGIKRQTFYTFDF